MKVDRKRRIDTTKHDPFSFVNMCVEPAKGSGHTSSIGICHPHLTVEGGSGGVSDRKWGRESGRSKEAGGTYEG